MSQNKTVLRGEWSLLFLALALLAACWGFHVKCARHGTPIYRDQHLGTAVEYAKSGLNLLKPVIIGFNATATPTPQELPVWQMLAGLAFKLLGPWYGWANVVSLLVFTTALFPLHQIAAAFSGRRCAAWCLVFFLSQPLIFIYAGEAGTDGFSLTAEIWFVYCALRLLRTPGFIWLAAACLTGALTAVSKLPFFMAAGLATFLMLVLHHRRSGRSWILLAAVGGVSLAVFLVWNNYTNHCADIAELPYVDLRLSNPEMKFWYFGDLHYRLNPANWLKGGWRILNCCFGSFALVALFLDGLLFRGRNAIAICLLAGSLVATLVFTHLVLHHSHYYLMFSPAIALLCALSAAALEKQLILDQGWKTMAQFGVIALVLGLSLVQGLIGMKTVVAVDPYPYDMAGLIDKYTLASDRLLIEGGGWGGNELMLSHRNGLSIWNTKLLENPETLRRLKQLGYNKLVMVSESPLITAVQQINPGQSKTPRESYRLFLTSVAADWPVVFASDDLLIKQIP